MASKHRSLPINWYYLLYVGLIPSPRIICSAIFCIVLAATWFPGSIHAEAANDITKKNYAIPGGLLSDVLTEFAAAAGVSLSFDPTPLGSRNSEGLRGNYTVEEGFRKLLQGSGFELIRTDRGVYSLVTSPENPNITKLPEMVVTGGKADGYVAKRTKTATKTDTPIIEAPQSISVVTRDEMDMRSVQNFTEALRYVPGVTVDQFGFEGRGYEYLLLRGFNGLNNANFRDGLSNAAFGFFSSFITDPYGLERIDVLRGPSSVLFGRGDAGGIVNRVTKLPNAAPIREIQLQYGNFDRKRIAADLGAATEDGKLMFRLVTTALDTDTQVKYPNTGGERAEIRRFYIAPSITWRPTVNTTITLMGDVLNNRSGTSLFQIVAPDGSQTRVLQSDPKFTRYAANQSSIGYQIEHHFNEIFTVRQNFRYTQQKGRFRDMFGLGFNTIEQPTLLDRQAYGTNERLTQTVLDSHLQAKLDTGPVSHTVLLGADWNQTNLNLKYFEGYNDGSLAPAIDILNPVYGIPIATPDALGINSKERIDQLGFYIQDQMRYNENWILTLSGRFDRIRNRDKDFLIEETSKRSDSAFTGRAGLTYLFSNGIAPYFGFSQSFLPQTSISADGKPFDPTRGTQFEAGVKYQPAGGRSLYTVAFFDLTKTNVLTRDPNDPAGFALMQSGKVRSRGIELEARTELYRGLNAIASFTYHDVENIKDTDFRGNTPIQVPDILASGWLDYSFGALGIDWLRDFGLGFGVRHVGRVYNDEANTSTTPSFTLFDATLRYEKGPILFTINSSNIFNNKYVSTTFFNRQYPGTERTVIGTLSFRF
ncbi:iron complex outermembrane recepter protein [Nitrosomonas marina]|uniref:Iron complex outermembrane recepter protein n=1 Tax=Nitrosomonas marina TaxID=917 RepID=A0A1H9YN36_9PROT|nr:TonB-dependent siderophore receptor [Nitrosomonas marina]SES70440.1 iron complex outermembrane recepter protein [Nitrosomonas marina]